MKIIAHATALSVLAFPLLLALSVPSATASLMYMERHDFDVRWKLRPDQQDVVSVTWNAFVIGHATDRYDSERYNKKPDPPITREPTPVEREIQGDAVVFDAWAESRSKLKVEKRGTGFHLVEGEVGIDAEDAGARASSYSDVEIFAGVEDAKGSIDWHPTIFASSLYGFAPNRAKSKDPIDFLVENLDTGEILESRLFEIDVSVSDGAEVIFDKEKVVL